jgi:hypothetical protein
MKPEDLNNPDGLKSTQKNDEISGNPAANDEISKVEVTGKAAKEGSEIIKGSSGETPANESGKEKDTKPQAENSEKPVQDDNSGSDDSDSKKVQIPEEDAVEDTEAEDNPKEGSTAKPEDEVSEDSEDKLEPADKKEDPQVIEAEADSEAQNNNTEKKPEQKALKDIDDEKAIAAPEEKSGTAVQGKAAGEQQSRIKVKTKEPKETDETSDEGLNPEYSGYSLIELINEMSEVLDKNGEHDIKDEVESIKAAFYKKIAEEAEEQKKQFIEDGGSEEDFQEQENPYEQDMKDLLKRYRQVRHDYNKKMEQEKEVNLQLKYEIIEEIKGLIHKEESINKTFQEFRELQQRWREIGLVPQAKMKDLWDLYHFHVESFYDYIKINQELRDLDLKKNLEVKIRLCEQSEELLLEPNTIKAFNQLQKLHDRWREAGPVPRENKDDIWERFKAATAKINKKYQDFFENRKLDQKKNLDAKRALCEKVEEILESEIDNHKDWSEKSKEVVNLQKVWRTIGFAPRKDNNKIYSRFREACDKFFDAKRDFYSKNKELQLNNQQMKIELCMQAEALKESTDWRKATQDLINIQKQWKEIGPVPRKYSDALWKRFRAACDYFFEKKSDHFSDIDSEQVDNLNRKMQLINEVENFKSTGDVEENLKQLKDFQRRWTEIGHVPIKKKDEVQKKFRDSINKLFDELKLDDSKRNMLKFRTKMVSFSESSRGQNKMRLERDKYMTKLKQMENDLVLLDNNIGFFAKSKNAESLIEDVQRKIEQTKEKIEFLKNKIRVIDEMDNSDE